MNLFQHTDRASPMQFHLESMSNVHEITASPITAQMFGNAGVEHMVSCRLVFV